jgi:opacity protein-like surface antigen
MCWLRIFSERALNLSIKFVLLLTWVVVISLPCRLEALDNIEIYLAGYGMATQPSNQGLYFKGKGVSDERIQGDPGLGVKIGLFPSFFHGYVGMELESFGQYNSLRFSVVGNGIATTKGKSGLVTYSSMVNLLLRYPGRYVRPYAGIGGGISNGILNHADIPGRNDKNIEMASAPGHQYFGGIQLVLFDQWFVFGEYKYSAANYHWNQLSLNFRSEYFLGGFGYIF